MTPRMILSGTNYDHVLTLITLRAKFHIYKSKILEKRLSLDIFNRELIQYFKILRYQESCNFDVDKFMQK